MGFSDAVRSIKNIWGHGDEDDYARDEADDTRAETDDGYSSDYSGSYAASSVGSGASGSSAYAEKPAPAPTYSPIYGGKTGSSPTGNVRRLHAVSPAMRAREKNIYTIKPKRLDEATVAADCLKTGSAVIVNLEAVDRVTAIRIVDFMSGVCYGIDGVDGQPGHAMKLGEMIFLFTPSEFEITSDETDYAANRDHFFREVEQGATQVPAAANAAPAAASQPASSFASSYNTPVDYSSERRSWER